jgi:hypothetical protein
MKNIIQTEHLSKRLSPGSAGVGASSTGAREVPGPQQLRACRGGSRIFPRRYGVQTRCGPGLPEDFPRSVCRELRTVGGSVEVRPADVPPASFYR